MQEEPAKWETSGKGENSILTSLTCLCFHFLWLLRILFPFLFTLFFFLSPSDEDDEESDIESEEDSELSRQESEDRGIVCLETASSLLRAVKMDTNTYIRLTDCITWYIGTQSLTHIIRLNCTIIWIHFVCCEPYLMPAALLDSLFPWSAHQSCLFATLFSAYTSPAHEIFFSLPDVQWGPWAHLIKSNHTLLNELWKFYLLSCCPTNSHPILPAPVHYTKRVKNVIIKVYWQPGFLPPVRRSAPAPLRVASIRTSN